MISSKLRFIVPVALATFLAVCCTRPQPAVVAEELIVEAGVADLQSMMESGELRSETLVRTYLARIDRLDGNLKSVIAVNPSAVEQAGALDEERSEGKVRGPLHGIPVLLKDNIESMENDLPTTAGSLALAGNVTHRDAFLVQRLRQAGAVILGKANLSEWANFRSERSSSGWSAVGGQTLNPYDPTRTPCGSSSGSAVAVAANLTALAVGTETNGSVVCPATVNGVVGIKPTVGLVSRTGIVPISHSQDSAGPFGRTLSDAVLLLEAMIGMDENDAVTELAERTSEWDLTAHLLEEGLEGKRIGVLRSATGYHSEVDKLLEQAIEDMKDAGAVIIDDLEFEGPEGLSQAAYDVLLYEFKHDLNSYLSTLPDDSLSALTLEELIAFNSEHADEEMPHFGQEIFVKSQAKGALTEQEYLDALELVQDASRREGIDRLVAEHDLDAFVAPTGAPAWKIDLINGDHFMGGCSSYPARAGYPHITIPMGRVRFMPVGLSFMGAPLSEPKLIEMAYAYERKTLHRAPPELN
jgi:amidase